MDLTSQLRAAILAQSLPYPSTGFLNSLTTARSPPPPLPSLVATAKARLLAADLSSSSLFNVGSLPSFPPGVDAAATRELRLPRAVHVQVVDVENLSLSRWEQIEELEAVERGETTRGREVIRVTAEDENENGESSAQTQTQRPSTRTPTSTGIRPAGKNATHRLTLQDCKGTKVYAIELKRMDSIGVGKTQMGEKLLLKAGTVIARGTILLEPDKCVMLGGKVEAWQRVWMDGRLGRLRETVNQDETHRS
ncbi:hypothetical protein EDB80DRAFT_707359 [Ilyonectria destructans]|nr:hypothetical protein EDB80DRAFT_707359 [Ilyonectria destructans]